MSRRAVSFVTTNGAACLERTSDSITTLRHAMKSNPQDVRKLHFERSQDLICKNLMCEKVGAPCVCRVGRWMHQNKNQLRHCEWLSLRGNELQQLPGELWELRSLTHLDLSNNALSVLPHDVERLVNLEVLYVNTNQLQDLPIEIQNLSKLRYLNVADNNISDNVLHEWCSWFESKGEA